MAAGAAAVDEAADGVGEEVAAVAAFGTGGDGTVGARSAATDEPIAGVGEVEAG